MILSAPASGSGKTVVTCALMRALQQRGYRPCGFKCGPDYIDPMFHRSALGIPSCNLDLFLSSSDTVKALYSRYSHGCDAAICEGAMGLFDGLGGTSDRGSSWDVARTLDLPILLVLRPRGISLTLAALVNGLQKFREPNRIRGLFLTECSPALADRLRPVLLEQTGLPVVGFLPRLPEAALESRHLGLVTPEELPDLQKRLDTLGETVNRFLDFDTFFRLFDGPSPAPCPRPAPPEKRIPIGVARDEAFCFCYPETLDALEDAGAELCFFSPLSDTALPAGLRGLYLPGGYPERFARELSKNRSLLSGIRTSIQSGLPTIAECGGFLYLGETLQDPEGRDWPAAGVLPGSGFRTRGLVRFGYGNLGPAEDRGDSVPVHSFHHWDSTCPGTDLTLTRPLTGTSWAEGYATPTLYAGFPHLYLAGHPVLIRRFLHAAEAFHPMDPPQQASGEQAKMEPVSLPNGSPSGQSNKPRHPWGKAKGLQ